MSGSSETSLGRLVAGLFKALDDAGLPFVVLRNYEELPEATSNDIDLLVCPARAREAELILAKAADREGWAIHNRAHFSTVCLFFHQRQTKEQIQIDLFQSLNGAAWIFWR